MVPEGTSLLAAADLCGEPIPAECGGRGSCGRCLVEVVEGTVPAHCTLEHAERTQVLACQTPVEGALVLRPLRAVQLPHLVSRDRYVGQRPFVDWAPWPLELSPLCAAAGEGDLGVARDLGTTTLQLVVVRLSDGQVVGEASAYNPQIPLGADCISRIIAAERGRLPELARLVRVSAGALLEEALRESTGGAVAASERVRGYVVAGNLTMIHLLLELDPAGIRRVPAEPRALAFDPRPASALGWPGDSALVHLIPAAGAWVGGDIIAGLGRAGFPRAEQTALYVDLGTNGEIAVGDGSFALGCACSAGPAFEGGGIRCGMRADRGAVDGARLDAGASVLEVSVIGGGKPRGICGSGLIALTDLLLRAGWIDRGGRLTARLPEPCRVQRRTGAGVKLSDDGGVALYERDLLSLIRAKAAVFAGIRSLLGSLGEGAVAPRKLIVSGNFGRFLNLPAAMGIGLLPTADLARYSYVRNGSLEGAALALLSRPFLDELAAYQRRVTYVDLSELPGYMDEFVAASFLPHTSPQKLRLDG